MTSNEQRGLDAETGRVTDAQVQAAADAYWGDDVKHGPTAIQQMRKALEAAVDAGTPAPLSLLRGDSVFPSKEEIHHLAKLALEEMQREATTDPAAWIASYERIIMVYRRLALSKQQASDSEAWERANEAVKAANALQVEVYRLRSSPPCAGAMALLRRMSDSMDHMSPEDTIGYTNGSFWIDVATVEEIREAAYPPPRKEKAS